MNKQKNIYSYKVPKSGNEETSFFNIKGRITRRTFFLRFLFAVGLYAISEFSYSNLMWSYYEDRLFVFFETLHFYFLPLFTSVFIWIQGAKRMHDVNKSGWYFLIPFYNLYLIFCKGTKGNNDYGIDPKPMPNVTYFDELDLKDNISDSFQNGKTNVSKSHNDKLNSLPKNKDYSNLFIFISIVVLAIVFFIIFNPKESASTNEVVPVDTISITADSTLSSGGFDDSELIDNNSSDSNILETKTVSFENNSSNTVWLVYAFRNNSKWETIGWFKIEPNKSESFSLPESFNEDSIYWYAEDEEDGRWEGNDGVFCVSHPDAFHFYSNESNENCSEERNFHKLNLTGAFTSMGLSN